MEVIDVKEIGNRIKETRNQKGIPQEELVHRIGESFISSRTLIRIEKGLIKDPGIVTLGRIANALEVTLHTLLFDDLKSKETKDYVKDVYQDRTNGISDQEYFVLITTTPHPDDGSFINIDKEIMLWEELRDIRCSTWNSDLKPE